MNPTDVREIAAIHGFEFAERCVEQETTQIGREAAEPLWAILAELDSERWAAHCVDVEA